jgi:hypothetical protein
VSISTHASAEGQTEAASLSSLSVFVASRYS